MKKLLAIAAVFILSIGLSSAFIAQTNNIKTHSDWQEGINAGQVAVSGDSISAQDVRNFNSKWVNTDTDDIIYQTMQFDGYLWAAMYWSKVKKINLNDGSSVINISIPVEAESLANDGADIYVGARNSNGKGWIGKYDTSGNQLWNTTIAYAHVWGMGYMNGNLYATNGTNVMMLDSSGNIVSGSTNDCSMEFVDLEVSNGYVYSVCSDGALVKYDASLNKQWSVSPISVSSGVSDGTVSISDDGGSGVYAASSGGKVVSFDTSDGSTRWTYTGYDSTDIYSTAIGNGYVYVTGAKGSNDYSEIVRLKLSDGSVVDSQNTALKYGADGLSLSPDGKTLYGGDYRYGSHITAFDVSVSSGSGTYTTKTFDIDSNNNELVHHITESGNVNATLQLSKDDSFSSVDKEIKLTGSTTKFGTGYESARVVFDVPSGGSVSNAEFKWNKRVTDYGGTTTTRISFFQSIIQFISGLF